MHGDADRLERQLAGTTTPPHPISTSLAATTTTNRHHGSAKPRHPVQPSKIRDVQFDLATAAVFAASGC
jgi:hypothetical protein